MGFVIKSKDNGLDLFEHSSSVCDTTFILNRKGNYCLDNDVLYWVSILHDLGKANPLFQSNMENKSFEKICRHEISSILFIEIVPNNIRDLVAYLILSHHKSLNGEDRSIHSLYNEQTDILFKNHINNIEIWGKDVQEYLMIHYNINCSIPSKNRCEKIIEYYATNISNLSNKYSEYRGVIIMADHFSSCFYNNTERICLLDKLFIKPNVDCYNNVNELYPLSLINSDITKKHTLVIAPTGCGKTNFMMKRAKERIFYCLPYQASINAMYKRFKKDMGDEVLIGLKHASMNSLSFMDDNSKLLSNYFGLSIKVITPFQIMGILFRIKGYEALIMDLKGQDIILDEIHTYQSLSQACILHLINTLKYIGCRIHICTATIPSYLKDKIVDILEKDNTQIIQLNDEVLTSFNRHIIHTVCDMDIKHIKERYDNGEKILIVKNQVRKAQQLYQELKNIYPTYKILLIHSRFKRQRMVDIENILLNDFNIKNEPCIVISTQVVEVSIDINFDVMFTDCADIMSLIQRFGRINQQRKNIGVFRDIFVMKNKDKEYKPYNENICDKTFSILARYDNKVLDETKIQNIIDEVHEVDSIIKMESANPFTNDGMWKTKEFCNINSSIPKALEFKGYVGILASDIETYKTTLDSSLEIPIYSNIINGLTLSPLFIGEKIIGFIIPDTRYNSELGFF